MQKFIVELIHNNYLIGDYLVEVHNYSRRGLRNAKVYLNGKKVRLDKKMKNLKKNNIIIVTEIEKETGIEPIEMNLDIAYEDKNLLIINKEPFLIVHPTQKKVDKTLANGIVNYFNKIGLKSCVPRFYNRLDMNTSGLIIIAKNAYAQSFLQTKGDVTKKYKAIVKGIIPWNEKIIERTIGRVGDELRRVELSIDKGGQSAKTKITVLNRLEDSNLTLIEAELFTGRTHQIRAHISLEGFPILGDELYGGEDKRAKRQLLHSYKLSFNNPDSKFSNLSEETTKKSLNNSDLTFKLQREDVLSIEVQLPSDMEVFLNNI